MVAPAGRGLPRVERLHRLLHLGRVPGRALQLRQLPLALLLARALRGLRPRLVRSPPGMVARLASLLARVPDPVGARRLPAHLLLLPRRLLQGVPCRSAELRGQRAAAVLPGRAALPAHPTERAPVLPVPRAPLPRLPALRRVEGALVRRSRDG